MTLSSYPYEFARRAGAILGSDLEASITVRQYGVTLRAGSGTDAARRCDQAEARAEDGPCIDAMDQARIRMVEKVADGTGWDRWRRQAVSEGFTTAIAVPALARSSSPGNPHSDRWRSPRRGVAAPAIGQPASACWCGSAERVSVPVPGSRGRLGVPTLRAMSTTSVCASLRS